MNKIVISTCHTAVYLDILDVDQEGVVALLCWCLIQNSVRSHSFKYCSQEAQMLATQAFNNFNQLMADKLIRFFKGEYLVSNNGQSSNNHDVD